MMGLGAKLAKVTVKHALFHHITALLASLLEISTYMITTALHYALLILIKMSLTNAETALRAV